MHTHYFEEYTLKNIQLSKTRITIYNDNPLGLLVHLRILIWYRIEISFHLRKPRLSLSLRLLPIDHIPHIGTNPIPIPIPISIVLEASR